METDRVSVNKLQDFDECSFKQVLPYVKMHAAKNNAVQVLAALDKFGWTQHWLMFIGPDKGKHLDVAVGQLGTHARILELGCVNVQSLLAMMHHMIL